MKNYLDLLNDIFINGESKEDRTETGTVSLFGKMLEWDLRDGFPIVTTKKIFWKGVVEELLWFLRGETNIESLNAKGVHIWDEWADHMGEVGPCYGYQWRNWGNDQIAKLIGQILDNPKSRRLIVSAWNVEDIPKMKLPPCHMMFQCNVVGPYLDLLMYQRSCDFFLGVPFNISSYALLLSMIAQVTDKTARNLKICFGDAHIYNNHVVQVREQLKREPLELPELIINDQIKDINDFTFEDFELFDYKCHPAIKAPVAV